MADWRGTGQTTAEVYRQMGEVELRGVSPIYQRLCLGVAEDPDVQAVLEALPMPKRQPNLLLGTVRHLGGPIDDYRAFRAFVLEHASEVLHTMRVRRTQTNEAARCSALVPLLAGLPQPLALIEVGASAGLCLLPDRYAYRWDDRPVLGDSDLVLDCATTGPVPFPAALPEVVWRRGLDLNPLDVTDPDDVDWLESLIWPEETTRFGRLRAAVGIARTDPPLVVRGDLEHDLPDLLGQVPAGATPVVFHSAVLAYLDDAARAAFTAARLADERVVWISNEAPGVVAGTEREVAEPCFVLARDGRPMALAGGHGDTLDWFG